jgi:hypothetical protein
MKDPLLYLSAVEGDPDTLGHMLDWFDDRDARQRLVHHTLVSRWQPAIPLVGLLIHPSFVGCGVLRLVAFLVYHRASYLSLPSFCHWNGARRSGQMMELIPIQV